MKILTNRRQLEYFAEEKINYVRMALVGALLVVTILTFVVYQNKITIEQLMPILATLIGLTYTLGIFFIVKKKLPVPFSSYLVSMLDIGVVTLGYSYYFKLPHQSLASIASSPMFGVYLIIVLFSVVRLDERNTLFTGLLTGIAYASFIIILSIEQTPFMVFTNVVGEETELILFAEFMKIALLPAAGIIGYMASRQYNSTLNLARKSREQLELSRIQYELLSRNIPGVIFQFHLNRNNKMKLLYVSESIRPFFGLKPIDLLNSPGLVFSFLDKNQLRKMIQLMRDSVLTRDRKVMDFSALTFSNTPRWFRMEIAANPHHSTHIISGIVLDIDEKKRTEIALTKAKNAAEKANQAKSEFIANISHELRTPLNGIIGMNELLMKSNLSRAQTEYAEAITFSSENLLFLINEILDYSKLEAGKLTLDAKKYNISSSLHHLSGVMIPLTMEKQLRFYMRIDPDLPGTYIADGKRIEQILMNLIHNAIKFTEKGFVLISVDGQMITKALYQLSFTVKDTGIGIPQEFLPAIFDKFSQADTSLTRKYGGTGLGLTICKYLCDLMGGHIEIHTSADSGSEFTLKLTLPYIEDPVMPGAEKLRGLKLLCVEIDDMRAEIFTEAAESLGCIVQRYTEEGFLSEVDLSRFDAVFVYFSQLVSSDILESHIKAYPDIMWFSIKDRIFESLKRIPKNCHNVRYPVDKNRLGTALLQQIDQKENKTTVQKVNLNERSDSFDGLLVLLVEDNRINQRVQKKMLEKTGCRVDIAGDGYHAVELAGTKKYDLIFMDIQMPGMDGLKATEKIRQERGVSSQTPVIALTGHALPGDKDFFLESGMNDYLCKPVKMDDIKEVLKHWRPD